MGSCEISLSIFLNLIALIRAPPPAPNQAQASSTDSSLLSGHVTHSILVSENTPAMTFTEALQRSQNHQQLDETVLGDEEFVQWNIPSPAVPTPTGLPYTPP